MCWWKRDALSGITKRLQGFARLATNSFGFEAINRGVVRVTQNTAEALRVTQTGLLSWNVAGIADRLDRRVDCTRMGQVT